MTYDAVTSFELFSPFGELFDEFSETVFFIKDIEGRYVLCNKALLPRCSCKNKSDLLGKTASQVLGEALGGGYELQDRSVIANERPLRDFLELHVYPDHTVNWCITNKYPLYGSDGKIIGLAGTSRDLKPVDMEDTEFSKISPVLEYVTENLHEPPTVEHLSTIVNLSIYQLDRRIQRIFGLTTGQWILKQRLDLAQNLLASTDTAIAGVALATGYSDQSAFTRQFRKTTGLTPIQFRSFSQRQT